MRNPLDKYGNHDVHVIPPEQILSFKDGPIVLFKLHQFHCLTCDCGWTKGGKQSCEGCKCRKCLAHLLPYEVVYGKTPYQGPRRVFGKFLCQHCNRFWGSSYSWANMFQNCQSCSAQVYPFKQKFLRRRTSVYQETVSEKRHLSELCEKCLTTGINCTTREDQEIAVSIIKPYGRQVRPAMTWMSRHVGSGDGHHIVTGRHSHPMCLSGEGGHVEGPVVLGETSVVKQKHNRQQQRTASNYKGRRSSGIPNKMPLSPIPEVPVETPAVKRSGSRSRCAVFPGDHGFRAAEPVPVAAAVDLSAIFRNHAPKLPSERSDLAQICPTSPQYQENIFDRFTAVEVHDDDGFNVLNSDEESQGQQEAEHAKFVHGHILGVDTNLDDSAIDLIDAGLIPKLDGFESNIGITDTESVGGVEIRIFELEDLAAGVDNLNLVAGLEEDSFECLVDLDLTEPLQIIEAQALDLPEVEENVDGGEVCNLNPDDECIINIHSIHQERQNHNNQNELFQRERPCIANLEGSEARQLGSSINESPEESFYSAASGENSDSSFVVAMTVQKSTLNELFQPNDQVILNSAESEVKSEVAGIREASVFEKLKGAITSFDLMSLKKITAEVNRSEPPKDVNCSTSTNGEITGAIVAPKPAELQPGLGTSSRNEFRVNPAAEIVGKEHLAQRLYNYFRNN